MPRKPAKRDPILPVGQPRKSKKPKRERYSATWSKISTILERTRKGRAQIDAILAIPDDELASAEVPDDTPVGYSDPMSLPDMDGREAIDISASLYTRILLEAQRRRKTPDDTSDELVTEALDRVLAEVQSLGTHQSLTPIEPPAPRPDDLASFKRAHILKILDRYNFNVSDAARALGIHRTSLQRRMRALDIDPITGSLPDPGIKITAPAPMVQRLPDPHANCDHEGVRGVSNCKATMLFVQPDPLRGLDKADREFALEHGMTDRTHDEIRAARMKHVPVPAPEATPRYTMCEYQRGERCANPLRWRGSNRCGCPRPSRSAA